MTTAAPYGHEAWASVHPGGSARETLEAGGLDFDGSALGNPTLPGPADLLATALAACLSKNLERFSRILGFRYQRGRVTVRRERQAAPARITRAAYLVEVTNEESEERLQLLHRNLRKHGPVTNTLAAACQLSGELRRAATEDDEDKPQTLGPRDPMGAAPS